MHDRVTICGGVLGGHPRLVADEILALSVANCRSTWRWRDGSSARMGPDEKARMEKNGIFLIRTDFINKKVCPKEGTRVRIPGMYHITTWYGAVGH